MREMDDDAEVIRVGRSEPGKQCQVNWALS